MLGGERINPTGKKKLQAELKDGRLDMVLSFAQEQEQCGASLLDVNVGMSGIDERDMMLRILDEVTQVSNLPLSIDSSHVEDRSRAAQIPRKSLDQFRLGGDAEAGKASSHRKKIRGHVYPSALIG